MKYKCFCENDLFSLSKDEVWHMLRGKKRFKPEEFVEHYNITPEMYKKMMHTKGFNTTESERRMYANHHDKVPSPMELYRDTSNEIPPFIICALYEVEFELKDGKRYYNVEQYEKAKEDAENKIERYKHILLHPEEKVEFSKLNYMDLVAMRIFRGFNRKRFSKESSLSMELIKEYESKSSKIPIEIEKLYKRVLGVKDRHIVQLRDILNGKSKGIVDDRTIPKLIKLKVWRRDKGKCKHCESKNKLHYHHIKHFADGGMHTEENLILLCASCHAEQHEGERVYHMLKKIAEE